MFILQYDKLLKRSHIKCKGIRVWHTTKAGVQATVSSVKVPVWKVHGNASVKSKVQHPPWGYPRHLTPLSSLGGNSITTLMGCGFLNSNLDFVLCVPVSERGLINHGGGRHVVRNCEFKGFKKRLRLCDNLDKKRIATKDFFLYLRLACRLGAWINSWKKAFLMTWNGSVVGNLNGFLASGGGNLNTKYFSKIQMPGFCLRGMLKLQFDRYMFLLKQCINPAQKYFVQHLWTTFKLVGKINYLQEQVYIERLTSNGKKWNQD